MTISHDSARSAQGRGGRFRGIDPTAIGSILGITSAFIYTCSNVCLRSVVNCNPIWVACMKAVPTMAVAVVLVSALRVRGRPMNLSPKVIAALVGTGLIGQIGGNVLFQYALEGIGLALGVPLTLSTIIIGGALLGRFWLGESVTPRMLAAMVLLLIAIPILSQGAKQERNVAEPAVAAELSRVSVLVGIVGACTAGMAYAWQGAVLRRMATSQTPHAVTLL
ncbi:MAG TPA: DMT family transporter, partial [Pirellulales bacterium]|nr:DMT family transporter [Pirellulales bacterium]